MKCPSCGAAELVADCRPITSTVEGRQIAGSDVNGQFCPACGEGVLDRLQGDRYAAALRLADIGGTAPTIANIPRRRFD